MALWEGVAKRGVAKRGVAKHGQHRQIVWADRLLWDMATS